MSMFCFQCQETARNQGCTVKGVCGKEPQTAALMDLLLYVARGVAIVQKSLREKGLAAELPDHFIMDALFCTIPMPILMMLPSVSVLTKRLS